MLNLASAWGVNPIWIYGGDSNRNESIINEFCGTAWQTGWLLRECEEYKIIEQCTSTDPCVNCDFEMGKGNWQIVGEYDMGSQYLSY